MVNRHEQGQPRVAVIGAGPAGLSAARALKRAGVRNVQVFEARGRYGGRVLTSRLGEEAGRIPFDKLSTYGPRTPYDANSPDVHNVDIGASVMHGCGDDCQFVYRRMIADRVRAPVVSGGSVYESTEASVWMKDDGSRISQQTITEMHRVYDACIRFIATLANFDSDGLLDMKTAWHEALDHFKVAYRPFTEMELRVLEKIMQRGYGYCAPLSQMGTLLTEAVVDPERAAHYHVGMEFDEEEDPPLSNEIVNFNPNKIRMYAQHYEKTLVTNKKPNIPVASRRGGDGDRIVIDGYTPSLINKLADDLDILVQRVIRQVEVADDVVHLSTEDDEIDEKFDYCICTVPIGVLQKKHEESKIRFVPELSQNKLEAINGLGSGVHNKVVLLYDEPFWTKNTPQMNCLDMRFQFFNLHAYEKTGVVVAHIYAESGFGYNYYNMTDEQVVEEVQTCLYNMFCSTGRWTTRVPKSMMPPKRKSSKVTSSLNEQLEGRVDEVVTDGEDTPMPLVGASIRTQSQVEEEILDGSDGTDTVDDPEEDEEDDDTKPEMPKPRSYIVTRWDTDPFSLGSYSYLPPGADFSYISEFRVPEKMGTERDVLFFAGEHASIEGWQCVHGAYESGLLAAHGILVQEGIVPAKSRYEDLDEYPPPIPKKSHRAEDMDDDEKNRLNRLCEEYAHSPGHLYDVLDEVMFVFDKDDGESDAELNYVKPTARDRNEFWKSMKQLAKNGYRGVEYFLKMRWQLAQRDARMFRSSFSKRKKKPRATGVVAERLDTYVEELEDIIVDGGATSVLDLAEKFATRIYTSCGAVIPWNAALISHVQAKLEEESVTLKFGGETKLRLTKENATLDVSKLRFPIGKTFSNWANGVMEEDAEWMPLGKVTRKKAPQGNGTRPTRQIETIEAEGRVSWSSVELESRTRENGEIVETQTTEPPTEPPPVSTTSRRTSTRKRRAPDRYGEGSDDSTNSSGERRIPLRVPLRAIKRRRLNGTLHAGEHEEILDEGNADDVGIEVQELLYAASSAETHQNGPWLENRVGRTLENEETKEGSEENDETKGSSDDEENDGNGVRKRKRSGDSEEENPQKRRREPSTPG